MSFGIPAALLFGLVLILASLGLFLTSKFKPDLHQESDNIYAIIGIICGLLLLISLDLGAAMAFQQLLMIGALISIMWQFLQVRAENKRLKGGGRSAGREAPPRKSGYTAQIDDEPEYAPAKRSNRRNKDRFDRSSNEREDREELPSRRSATRELPEERFAPTAPRRRLTEPARTGISSLTRRQNDSWDEEDWNEFDEPAQVRRALPDADLASTQSQRQSTSRRAERPNLDEPPQRGRDLTATAEDANPRRRRPERDPDRDRATTDRSATGQITGTTASYIDYEPIDPPSGLPPSDSEPIVFPDRY
ncbi:Ycf66 family protein [Chamaesiphon sp.]|uniref:Ycf66 family protein n=1 Tax=Chamaesiphon sp. TaxID=2814140 RepID=UPI0035934DDB